MQVHFHLKSFQELTPKELYTVLALRQEVFIVEQHCPYLDADGQDMHVLHLMGWTDDRRLAVYARLLPAGISYEGYASIGRVITAPFARGIGLGYKLMKNAIAQTQKKWEGTPIKISAQAHLQGFYQSLGFIASGTPYLEDGIPHIAMVLKG